MKKPGDSYSWCMSREEIERSSPSRKDGIDLKKENFLRKSYCTYLKELGIQLKVPPVTTATAIILCHRFYLRQSHLKNDRYTIATACMFLAGKVEETPLSLQEIIVVSYKIRSKKDPAYAKQYKLKESYGTLKGLLVMAEKVLLATLSFDLEVHHPYKALLQVIKKYNAAQTPLAQVAWSFVNDTLQTSLCFEHKPHTIAAAAIFLAERLLKVKVSLDGKKEWWQELNMSTQELEEVSNQLLAMYEQKGSSLQISALRESQLKRKAPPEEIGVSKKFASSSVKHSSLKGQICEESASILTTEEDATVARNGEGELFVS